MTLNKKLEGLRYALLAHLIVFSSEFREDCPTEKSEMLELFPTASAALEETLMPGGGVFTFTEWNDHILHWFPAVPWTMFIFTYDEMRKAIMRQNPDGWLNSYTYW